MQKNLHFLIIDDDQLSIDLYKKLLEQAGHTVTSLTKSSLALEQILKTQPDCVLCDLMMPNFDGLDIFQKLRANETIKQPVFIIITIKSFENDRQRALDLGVDGYLIKPVNPDTFVDELMEINLGVMTVQFWGVRGTLPVPGEKTMRYGGNTSCVTLSLAKKHFFIFDGGTGIKELSNYIVRHHIFPFSAKIFITHPHYDHINALPFFVPFFVKGNEFEIFGTNQGEKNIEDLISSTMDGVYLPFTIKEFAAKLKFRNLSEEDFFIENIYIQTILLNHPGRCLGYRVQYKNKIFCYITDNELYLESSLHYNQFEEDRLIHFIKECDILIIDATYMDDEYLRKVGWGHSSVTRVVDLADKAKVKLLCLFHHDPEQYDKDIDAKLKQATALLKARHSSTRCIAPAEGEKLVL
jgi:phosphoribosyl 1,2-cyclic phosphodiesterase/ActR/RegA family two-component response regulator